MDLREQFGKETGRSASDLFEEEFLPEYVEWLEQRLKAGQHETDVVGQVEQLKAFAEYFDEMHGGEEFAVNEIDNFMKSL